MLEKKRKKSTNAKKRLEMTTLPPISNSQSPLSPQSDQNSIQNALHTFTQLYESVPLDEASKVIGALTVLKCILKNSPHHLEQLNQIEQALTDPLDNLPSPIQLTTNFKQEVTLDNILQDVVIPMINDLPNYEDGKMNQIVEGAILMIKALSHNQSYEREIKALEYDISLYQMFPSQAAKEHCLKAANDLLTDL